MDETDPPTLPLDRYPDPALGYAVEDGRAVARAANPAFEREVGAVEAGTPVAAALERLDVRPVDGGGRLDPGVGGPRTVRVGDADRARYLVRTVPPEGDRPGHLLFVATPPRGPGVGVDSVASVVSHDLRNPLDVAKAHLRAARETGDERHFERVARSHDRIERIVGDVLTLARGDDAIAPTDRVDLEDVVGRARETIPDDEATVTAVDPLPTVVGDRDRLVRLFENLFRNSVQHGSTGDGSDGAAADREDRRVRVTVGRLDDADGVYVADDGPGIPEEDREAALEPGYTTSDRGTGLGLAIVERIAGGHGWSVAVTGATDGGARIEIGGIDPA